MKHDDQPLDSAIDELLARLPRHETPEALRRATRVAALEALARETTWTERPWTERLGRYALPSGLTLFSTAYAAWVVVQALMLG